MPSKNIIKMYGEDVYYHVYNRGVNKMNIFVDSEDYAVFLNLLKRYLRKKTSVDKKGREYESFYDVIDLIAFCLMPNHFHLFVFQKEKEAMPAVLKAVSGSYTMYFNKKYKRLGPLFQSRYKASVVNDEAYFSHISRYIHLNPKEYQRWEWSSLPYYTGKKSADWVKPGAVMAMFNSGREYVDFLESYIDYSKELKDIEYYLADT